MFSGFPPTALPVTRPLPRFVAIRYCKPFFRYCKPLFSVLRKNFQGARAALRRRGGAAEQFAQTYQQSAEKRPRPGAEEKEPQQSAAQGQRRHIKAQRPLRGPHPQQEQRQSENQAEQEIGSDGPRRGGVFTDHAQEIVNQAEAQPGQERGGQQEQLRAERIFHLSGTASPRDRGRRWPARRSAAP